MFNNSAQIRDFDDDDRDERGVDIDHSFDRVRVSSFSS